MLEESMILELSIKLESAIEDSITSEVTGAGVVVATDDVLSLLSSLLFEQDAITQEQAAILNTHANNFFINIIPFKNNFAKIV